MPEVHAAVEHLVDYLFEVGPGVGDHALTFAELEAWQRVTGARVDGWEASALRWLSATYLAMRQEASDAKCAAPVLRREALPDKKVVSDAVRDWLRSLNSAGSKKERAERKKQRETKAAKDDG